MKKILVALLAASLAVGPFSPGVAVAAPKKCTYGSVNGVCIEGTFAKKLSPGVRTRESCVYVKRGLFGLRSQPICKVDTGKKSFWFIGPVFAGVPTTAVIVGTATLGVVGGAAGAIGGKLADKFWPNKKAKGWHPGWGHYRPYHPNAGGAIISGIIGYIIGRNSNEPTPPPPAPEPAQVVLTPWTPEWYEYCNGKYKSFDAKTGFYTGYDGQQHFCQ